MNPYFMDIIEDCDIVVKDGIVGVNVAMVPNTNKGVGAIDSLKPENVEVVLQRLLPSKNQCA